MRTMLRLAMAILAVGIFGARAQAVRGPSVLQDQCSREANQRGLHGQARWEFRRRCKNGEPMDTAPVK
jgi:hypothetical protein